MNPFTTPTFVFDPHDPGTSPGFVLVLQLPKHRAALNQLQSKTLDFFTGGRATGCIAVLLVGLTDLPSSEQTRQLHQLSHRWGVAVVRRVTFRADSLARLEVNGPAQWAKVLFPAAGDEKPPGRAYTIRHLRPEKGELDIDFVLHGDTGPGSRWASRAKGRICAGR